MQRDDLPAFDQLRIGRIMRLHIEQVPAFAKNFIHRNNSRRFFVLRQEIHIHGSRRIGCGRIEEPARPCGAVAILGRIGELGQPLIARQADKVLAAFADCLRRKVAAR